MAIGGGLVLGASAVSVAHTGNSPAPPAKPGAAAGAGAGRPAVQSQEYYQKVYNAVADLLENLDYDDGSYAPVLVRLAWHAAGTYDKVTGTGGSDGSTMRFAPEAGHGANAGLKVARDLLEKVHAAYPDITYADLWSLAGVVAVQETVR